MNGEIAARLYRDVIAPLVLGGALRPGRPIGGAASVVLWEHDGAVDAELRSRTDLARTRVARLLMAIDVMPEASASDWTLLAVLHDWLAAASPELPSVLTPRAGDRLVTMIDGTLDHVTAPRDVHAALGRHTFVSRIFDVERKDIKVSFWAGSRMYLGTTPPERLVAWPELRRVRTETERRAVTTLAEHGARVDKDRWLALLTRILRSSPLTDIATATRETPRFEWSPETLGLVATTAGRTLAARALRAGAETDALTSLGRATAMLVEKKQWKSAAIAAELLAELVLALALNCTAGEWSRVLAEADRSRELVAGIAFGALTASARATPLLAPHDAASLDARLGPLTRSAQAKSLLAP